MNCKNRKARLSPGFLNPFVCPTAPGSMALRDCRSGLATSAIPFSRPRLRALAPRPCSHLAPPGPASELAASSAAPISADAGQMGLLPSPYRDYSPCEGFFAPLQDRGPGSHGRVPGGARCQQCAGELNYADVPVPNQFGKLAKGGHMNPIFWAMLWYWWRAWG